MAANAAKASGLATYLTNPEAKGKRLKALYDCLAQRSSVAKFGGLPNIIRPTRKIFEATQVVAHAASRPTVLVVHTCQIGGGDVEAMRVIIASVLTGRMKLSAMAIVVLGSRATGAASSHVSISTSITGVTSACASRISLTAAPIAPNTEANRK